MNRKAITREYKNFFIVTLVYTFATIGDFITTYMYTPDLSMEANPFVTLFGSGWKCLFVVNAIGFAFFMFVAYFTFIHYKHPVIQCKSYKEYVSMLYFETPDEFKKVLYKKPKNKLLILFPMGYAYIIGNICCRIFTDIMAILAIKECYPCLFCFMKAPHTYCNMLQLNTSNGIIIIPAVTLSISVFSMIIAFCIWHVKEYIINKKETEVSYGKQYTS